MTKGANIFEEKAVHNDGEKHRYLATKSPFFDSSGNIIGTVGLSVSLTNFNRDKELLEENWLENLNNNKNIQLTKREIECVNWLAKGKSAVEISLLLSLSQRTVETHINNIKHNVLSNFN